ncbi:MAG: hypothetical protein HOF44_10205 [Pelagibacterales bacterium]|nr:hypothetical protein [Pelagibacterales bacterium]
MIVNENTDVIAELKKRKARRDKIPKTYTQLQYERAEAKQNKIKNHNEKLLKNLRNNTKV